MASSQKLNSPKNNTEDSQHQTHNPNQPSPQQYKITYTHPDEYIPNFTFILHQDEQLRWRDLQGNIVFSPNRAITGMLSRALAQKGMTKLIGKYVAESFEMRDYHPTDAQRR